MRLNRRKLGMLACLVAMGCGDAEKQTAGGQSGTDANGGFHCAFKFEQAEGEPVALDEPAKTGLSPNDYYARLEGTFSFACDDDTKYSVSISRGDAARRALGLLNGSVPHEWCEGLQLDAEIHVENEDGSFSHDAQFLTANLVGSYEIGGLATDSAGREITLILREEWTPQQDGPIERLSIDRSDYSTVRCVIPTGEGGAGGAG
jgi:hypothetical protein